MKARETKLVVAEIQAAQGREVLGAQLPEFGDQLRDGPAGVGESGAVAVDRDGGG